MTENEDIHCNALQCRRALCLEAEACVTSCSHIFCIRCANNHFNQALVCPACSTSLTQSDDIVVTQLNPTEEYKSSILAGLKPDVIMDISSRAIAFYYYQTSQELSYQKIMHQNLETKCSNLQEKLRENIRDTNRTIKAEKQKNTALMRNQEQEKRRVHDLQTQLHEKTRQFQKLTLMYDKLKRKTVTPNMQQTLNQQLQISHILQPQERTPESMSTDIPPTLFSASDNATRLRCPYPYAPSSTARAESPSEHAPDSNNVHNNRVTTNTAMIQQSAPASPTATHHRRLHASKSLHHTNVLDGNAGAGTAGGFLLTTSYTDPMKQQLFAPTSIPAGRNNVRINSTLQSSMNTSSRQQEQPQPSSSSSFFQNSNNMMAVQPPPPSAHIHHTTRPSHNHHKILDNNNNHEPFYPSHGRYATVVSPQARSVAGNISRPTRPPMATPSPRLRPFTSAHRVALPQPSHQQQNRPYP